MSEPTATQAAEAPAPGIGGQEVAQPTSRSKSIIKPGIRVMIRLPSEGLKIVELNAGGVISLGKFGSFAVNEVLGFQFGQSFEIVNDKKVKPIKSLESDLQQAEEDLVDEIGELTQEGLTNLLSNSAENNQNIIDIGSKIQKLNSDDIDELKKSGASSKIGQLIIQKMVQGHEGFDKKTIFSQQKYLKRKQQKFLRRFTIEYLGSSQLLQYYIEKDLQKVLDMSEESLSLLLTYANVRPGGKYLLLDETSGVVLYAMLERMNMEGQIVLLHENEHMNNSALKNTDVSDADLDRVVKPINWLQFAEPENEKIVWEDLPEEEIEDLKQNKKTQYFKRQKRARDINEVISLVEEGNFDGVVCVTTLDLTTVMPFIIPRLGGSRAISIYSQFKEVLLEAQHVLQIDKRILAPSIFETRVRPYQTIPGRMHPLMTMRGFGGYVLWATRVYPKEGGVQAVGRGLSKKRNERSAEPEVESEDTKKPKVNQ